VPRIRSYEEGTVAMATILALDGVLVTIGVDTHRDTLTAVALDQRGGRLDAVVVANHPGGFAELVAWAEQLGVIDAFAVEGTGSYGGPLAPLVGPARVRRG